MSVITDVLFVPGWWNNNSPAMHELLTWKYDRYPLMDRSLANVRDGIDKHQCGSKVWCSHVYAASWNYFPVSEFVDFVKGLDWPDPNWVLVLDYEHEDHLIIVRGTDE